MVDIINSLVEFEHMVDIINSLVLNFKKKIKLSYGGLKDDGVAFPDQGFRC